MKVAVVLQPDAQVTPEELLDFCQGRMAHYAVPRYVEFVDELPKTETQRIQYAALKQRGVTRDTWDREAAGLQGGADVTFRRRGAEEAVRCVTCVVAGAGMTRFGKFMDRAVRSLAEEATRSPRRRRHRAEPTWAWPSSPTPPPASSPARR